MEKLDLKAVIQQYPDCTVNRARLKATLLDCYPQAEHRREINVILAVYESGVLSKFQGKNSLSQLESSALCTQLENDYGIAGEYAVEGLVAWGNARGVQVSAAVPPKHHAAPTPVPNPAPPKPIAPVQGSVSEYVIEERKEGWFITKFQGFEQEDMTIPNIIDGKVIVGIGEGVFQRCKEIKTMTISNGIRFLNSRVFECCDLKRVILPDTLEKIGASAFKDCRHLDSIIIPDSVVEIGESAFFASGLKIIVLPKYLKRISKDMFFCCRNLSNVKLPEHCETIERNAFRDCRALHEIQIPPDVISIADFGLVGVAETLDSKYLKTIYCAPGSAAMEYARRHGIQCKPL